MPSQRLAILLGSCQGERFLARQLASIKAQSFEDWKLVVSDDGSTDGTLAILDACRQQWRPGALVIKAGPSRGFRANFLALACDESIEADYFAFCDQDDVWDAIKLAVAMRWIEKVPDNVPALYCARTRLIDDNDRPLGFSPLFRRPAVFQNAIVQSIAGGNTMVFNRAARALLSEAGADVAVQTHDWWLYILVTACGGRVFYDAVPTVGYRQHGGNLVGSNASWAARLRRLCRILTGHFKAMNDGNIAALQRMRHRLSPDSARVLDGFIDARRKSLLPRVLGVRRAGVFCQTLLSSVALYTSMLLNRL